MDADLRQYLTFRLGGLEYALDFRRVQELRPLGALERVAAGGEIVPGVAVSRGVILPIVDMRVAFGRRDAAQDPQLDCIILRLSTCTIGMVTDGVSDVVLLSAMQVRPLATGGKQVDYLLGVADSGGRRLIVLDIDRLMAIRGVALGARQAA